MNNNDTKKEITDKTIESLWTDLREPSTETKVPLTKEQMEKIRDQIFLGKLSDVELRSIIQKERTKGCHKIAKFLTLKDDIKTIGEKVREIYIYKDGIYILGETILRNIIEKILQEEATKSYKNEIIDRIKDLTRADRKEFDDVDLNFINLNNGVLNIKTLEFTYHSKEYCFFTKIPVSYDPKTDCPNIKKFLLEILNEGDVKVIQEWFGYCLYRRYFIKKAIIFVGERDTGKTTLLNLLSKFIGKENVSAVSLQRLTQDKFATANLYTKNV